MKVKCIDNDDFEDCLTIGKIYNCEYTNLLYGGTTHLFITIIDDQNNCISFSIFRFEVIEL